ncbi:MAG: ABC transporter substrate-binding protein [Deltaproteobacteria bacterium]|nr:ABC transporter substrate-binding protein [Deltaproteobacteria bacterium]
MPLPRRLASPVLLLALLCCTGSPRPAVDAAPVDAGPPALPEAEPNDAQEQALLLERDGEVSAGLSVTPGKQDVDWYVLASPTPRVARVEVTAIPGADVAVELYDAAGARRATVDGQGEGQPELLPNLGVSGKAWLKVLSLKKGSGGAYAVKVRFEAPLSGVEQEPDDRAADAVLLGLGSPARGYLSHGADEDWYRLELPVPAAPAVDAGEDGGAEADGGEPAGAAPRALKLELSGVEGVRHELSLLSEAEAVLFSAKGRAGEGLAVRNVGLRPQDAVVYLVVRSLPLGSGKEVRRGSNPAQGYALTATLEEGGADAELEPNDTLERATQVAAEGERHGFLSPASDVDLYAVELPEGRLLRAKLSGVEGVDLQLSLVTEASDGGEQELLRANEGGEKEPERLSNVACAGTCYVRVSGVARKVDGSWVKDQESADRPYTLSLSTVADDGTAEREPNDDAAHAGTLRPGQSMRGTVYPRKDVDLFRVDLADRPVKTQLVATMTGVLKVDVALFLHRQEADGTRTLVQSSDRAKGDKPEAIRYAAEPGTYLLEVRDSRQRESNFQDGYVLRLEEGQE